jgi:hypothetical protein
MPLQKTIEIEGDGHVLVEGKSIFAVKFQC